MCLDVKVSPKIPRTKNKAVSEDNDPVSQNEFGSGEITMVELYRVLKKTTDNSFDRTITHFDHQDKTFEESKGEIENKDNHHPL